MRGAPFREVIAPDVTASTALWPTASSSARRGLDPHLRDRGRIARLFAMVCMAVVWAYLVGEHKDIYVKPISKPHELHLYGAYPKHCFQTQKFHLALSYKSQMG